jgi:hypothetical protein
MIEKNLDKSQFLMQHFYRHFLQSMNQYFGQNMLAMEWLDNATPHSLLFHSQICDHLQLQLHLKEEFLKLRQQLLLLFVNDLRRREGWPLQDGGIPSTAEPPTTP